MTEHEPIKIDTNTNDWKETADNATGDIRPVGAIMSAPGLSHLESIRSNIWAMGEGDAASIAGSCVGITGTLLDFAAKIGSFGSPSAALQTVVSMGFDIVLALVQPLEDLLHMVSGDPGGMRDKIDLWGRIGEALQQLSGDTAEVIPEIDGWSTVDGQVAKTKLDDLAATLDALGKNTGGIEQLLGLAQTMAELIKEAIKWVISWLITKLIESAIAGAAGAVVTFGSSVAAAICKMVGDAISAMFKALGFTKNAMKIANKFADICIAISGSQTLSMTKGVLLTAGGAVATAAGNAAQPLFSTLGHSDTAMPSSTSVVEAGIIVADIQAITDAETKLRPLATDATHIADVARETTDGELTWGICALLFEDRYKQTANDLTGQIELCETALSGSADKLKASAEDWEAVDQEIKEAFDGLIPE
ncbi:hypothetical protein [Glycomyces sp. NPDC048151]|uniref:hypothetical protein n=1 Tax=Glycomyces sp. NPDC048151 TaxID=3364002 RepID=UPI00371C6C92